eukprot:TRINITY_DN5245_c2_g1_i1.p1 TRINITY_DN5245_c2_g1~~TRINITY_DN5245_c2_g1_i1.p1  ORF type:complete len:568 (+),score=117.94 TRINITY_DN5245_c2_g1_i1:151-1854(+)
MMLQLFSIFFFAQSSLAFIYRGQQTQNFGAGYIQAYNQGYGNAGAGSFQGYQQALGAQGFLQGQRSGIMSAVAIQQMLPAVSWSRCGMEGEALQRAGLVRFGYEDKWTMADLPTGSECSLASFNQEDPRPFTRKVCECAVGLAVTQTSALTSTNANSVQELGVEWQRCAGEGQTCACSSGEVRYGEGTRWASLKSSTSTTCSTASFKGDPSYGRVKECWCMTGKADVPPKKVAVVMLSRHPADIKTWLKYHLNYLGLHHVFIQVEDSPDIPKSIAELPQDMVKKVTLWGWGQEDEEDQEDLPATSLLRVSQTKKAAASADADKEDKRPTDDYTSLQARQLKAMTRAKTACQRKNIDWLIHIDDDELLYAPYQRKIGDLLAETPELFDQAFIPNVEAVYPSASTTNCFADTKEVNIDVQSYQGYVNGKTAIRANSKAYPAGPHLWRGPNGSPSNGLHLDKEPFGAPLLVVHYESCPFGRWQDKFFELGNTSPDAVDKIPFPFYRESITKMQLCKNFDGSINRELDECTQDKLMAFWEGWKTEHNSRYERSNLMPINIPWDQILKEDEE